MNVVSAQITQLNRLLHNFNWNQPSWDLFIILAWLVASIMYAFAAGRGRILTVLLSVYMAKLLVIQAPFLSTQIAEKAKVGTGYEQLLSFALLFGIFFIFLGRYVFRTSIDRKQLSGLIFSLIFSVLQVGLLVNTVLTLLPGAVRNSFSPLVKFLFVYDPASFVWLLLPVAFLVVVGRFISDRTEM